MLQSARYKVHCYHKITGNLNYQYVSLDANKQTLSTFTPEDGNLFSVRNIVMLEHNKVGHVTEQTELAP
jgi:hypothetical protein